MTLFDRLKHDAASEWQAYCDHEFVRRMGEGTLARQAFQTYLVQDYLFLIQFARACALGIYKGRNLAEMRAAHEGVKAILDVEMDLHVRLCGEWGLSPLDLEQTPEALQTISYTRFVLDKGMQGDLLDLHVALSPCVIGYAEIGQTLAEQNGDGLAGNPYHVWISEYAGETYNQVAQAARDHLDELAKTSFTEARYPDLLKTFRAACLLEAGFWQMGIDSID